MTTNTGSIETSMTIAWYKVWANRSQTTLYDVDNALTEILCLPTDPDAARNRYWIDVRTNKALYIDDPAISVNVGTPFTLHQVVRDRLPEIDNAGNRYDMGLVPPRGLVHTAVGLVIEDKILGLAFTNSFQPSIKNLATYIGSVRNSPTKAPVILPAMHEDALSRILNADDLTSASLVLESGARDLLLAERHELFMSMEVALEQEPTTKEVPIAWNPVNTSGFSQRTYDRYRPLLDNPVIRPLVKKMQAKARVPGENKQITINVLSDKLTESVSFENPNPQSARIDVRSVVRELEQSYNRLEDAIGESVGANIRYEISAKQLRLDNQ